MFKNLILFISFSIFTASVSAQDKLIFENISIDKGLSSRVVNCIVQDDAGFLWFGTDNGLNKYDGYNFKIFKHDPNDSLSISNSRINCFCKTQDNRLWIGTDKGLNIYNPVKETFISVKPKNDNSKNLDNSRIRAIYEDRFHALWIGTQNGLFKYNPIENTIKLMPFGNLKKNAVLNIIRCIYEDNGGILWIGTFDGLFSLNPFNGIYKHYKLKKQVVNEIPNNLIISLHNFESDDQYLWVGTESGLCKFNKSDGSFVIYSAENKNSCLSNSTIKCILQYNKDELLLGTDWGLDLFDINTQTGTSYNHSNYDNLSISDDIITSIYKDKAGIVWMATSNGISKLNTKRKKFDTTILNINTSEINVSDITNDKDGNVWIGTFEGIFEKNAKSGKISKYLLDSPLKINRVCRRVFSDKYGVIWAGTQNGLQYWDKSQQKIRKIDIPESPLLLKYIFGITQDESGNIWTNVNNGLCQIIPKRNQDGTINGFSYYVAILNSKITSNRNNEINCIQSDKATNIWFGISNEGLYKYNILTKKFKHYRFNDINPKSINSNSISAIFIDKNKKVYILTDRGLCTYNEMDDSFNEVNIDKLYRFSLQNGIADNNNNIWLSTFLNLIQYNVKTGKTISYNFTHELKNKGFISNSIYKNPQGRIYIGSYDRYVSFLPEEISSYTNVSPLLITSVKVFDNDINWERLNLEDKVDKKEIIQLNYNQNFIKIYFSLLDFYSPSNNKYSYMLDGIDKQWMTTTGIQNYATYSNLPPGNYVFKLKGANPDGFWNKDITSLFIQINPPWWISWWAYTLYVIILGFILYFIIKTARSRFLLANELKLEKIEHEKTEEINLIKLRFFTNISHEFRTPLSLILGPIETLMENTEPKFHEQLQIMKSNANRLLRLINQIMDFRKIENKKMELNLTTGEIVSFVKSIFSMFNGHAAARKIEYIFDSSSTECIMSFDRDKIEKVIYNLLSNAFKFTPENGCITLSIEMKTKQEVEYVEISVSDTGIGINDEEKNLIFQRFYQSKTKSIEQIEGTGIGLTLCKEFVELHKGEIFSKNDQKVGSTFVVLLPIENAEILSSIDIIENTIQTSENITEKERILIVEDNLEMRQYLAKHFSNNYEISEAANGKDGMDLIQIIPPDLIISDLMMPVMDGLEFCNNVKSNMLTSHIPFIILTAKANEELAYEGLSFGADDYITKPFSLKLLNIRIAKLIEQRKMLQEHFKLSILSNPQASIPESNDEKFMYLTVKAIDENIDNFDLNIELLCQKLNITHQQIYRKIKALTGQTVSEFIRSVRLKEASQLLCDSDMNVSEIMFSVGFSNRSYFSKCFSEQYSLTPKEYREKMSKNND
ncbi:MAG: ATP-binding protein [Bacteroidia bacterium]|nr:ATP-binding protein [Bacteroidia bacterium]